MAQSHGSKVDNHYDRQAAEGEWYVKSLLTKAVWGEGFYDEKSLSLNSIKLNFITRGVNCMLAMMKKLWGEERGQGMTEYGLILALIVIAVIAVLTLMGGKLKNTFTEVNNSLK